MMSYEVALVSAFHWDIITIVRPCTVCHKHHLQDFAQYGTKEAALKRTCLMHMSVLLLWQKDDLKGVLITVLDDTGCVAGSLPGKLVMVARSNHTPYVPNPGTCA